MTTNHNQQTADVSENMRITVISGRHKDADLAVKLPLAKNLLIGSHIDCDLVISDDGVAISHAILFEHNGCIWAMALPGCSQMLANGVVLQHEPIKLTHDMVFSLGSGIELRVQSSSLPHTKSAATVSARAPKRSLWQHRKATVIVSLACITCSAILLGLSLNAGYRLPGTMDFITANKSAENFVITTHSSEISSLEESARQVDRYLADPGVKVLARSPKRIEVSGIARSIATREQLEKIQKFLPVGVEISSTVSYPVDKMIKITSAPQDQQMSKLAKKILQVASSEKVPYIEIEGGTRIFEGGQLNGYELMKISPNVIVARRDNKIENFKVE
jgi:hypothetical protein